MRPCSGVGFKPSTAGGTGRTSRPEMPSGARQAGRRPPGDPHLGIGPRASEHPHFLKAEEGRRHPSPAGKRPHCHPRKCPGAGAGQPGRNTRRKLPSGDGRKLAVPSPASSSWCCTRASHSAAHRPTPEPCGPTSEPSGPRTILWSSKGRHAGSQDPGQPVALGHTLLPQPGRGFPRQALRCLQKQCKVQSGVSFNT